MNSINSSPRLMTLKEKAYISIKEDIISCKLAPGSLINEREVAEKLKISRTPLREALIRLEQEGLVEIIPQRGVFVSNISVKVILELYQIREVLEPFIVRLATPLACQKKLDQFRNSFLNILDKGNIAEVNSHENLLDNQFHSFLAESCGNNSLEQIIANIRIQTNRIRILSCRNSHRLQKAVEEHVSIIDAMLECDEEKAARIMRTHILRSRHAAF